MKLIGIGKILSHSSFSCSSNGKQLIVIYKGKNKSKIRMKIFNSLELSEDVDLKIGKSSLKPFGTAKYYPKIRIACGENYVYITNGKKILKYSIFEKTIEKIPLKRKIPIAISIFDKELFFLCKSSKCLYSFKDNKIRPIICDIPKNAYDLAVNKNNIFIASTTTESLHYQLSISVYEKTGTYKSVVQIPIHCPGDLTHSIGSLLWDNYRKVLCLTHSDIRISFNKLHNICIIEENNGDWFYSKSTSLKLKNNPFSLAFFMNGLYVTNIDDELWRYELFETKNKFMPDNSSGTID